MKFVTEDPSLGIQLFLFCTYYVIEVIKKMLRGYLQQLGFRHAAACRTLLYNTVKGSP